MRLLTKALGPAAALVASTCGGGSSAPPTRIPLGAPQQGVATYYAATGDGACMFGPSPTDLMVAALDAPQYGDATYCGACADVTGPNGNTIRVRIVDECPGCEVGHLDLSQQAFSMIADPSLGRVPVTWSFVKCDVTGPVEYRYKEGSSQWWTAIQVRNIRVPVVSLEVQQSGAFVSVPRQTYNYFVAGSGLGPDPLTVRITSLDGQQLTDTIPPVMAGQVYSGAAQFQ